MTTDISRLRKFVAPEIIFGSGARHSLGNYALKFGTRKALIVSDPGVVAAGWVADAQQSLEEQGIAYSLFTALSPNPRDEEVMAGVEQFRAENCNVIVAVGGGSPMDCAKGIGIVAANGGSILSYEGVDTIDHAVPPLIFIPTTSGTSADVSQFAIISDQKRRVKFSIVSKALVPDVALIDPDTTSTMEPFLIACTGVDAMVHAVEAFVSTGAGPLTDSHALDVIRVIKDNLAGLVADPSDNVLRQQIMLGSMKAGLAFTNAILGAVHAMSHSLGGWLDLPHGLCNAMLLEHVMAYNYDSAPERFRALSNVLDVDDRGMNDAELKRALITSVLALKQSVGLKDSLGTYGVKVTDIPSLSSHALRDPCILTNPRQANQRDIEVVYEEAL